MTVWIPKPDDGREDRVRIVKDRVRRGEYHVPAESVADAVIAWYRRMEPGERPTRR